VDDTSLTNVQKVRDSIPALYLSGSYLVYQTPENVARHGLTSSLYADGWWLYYGWAILNHSDGSDPKAFDASYGRVKGTASRDYLDAITAMHGRLDGLLVQPKSQWPTREGLSR
jgi:hypothetical protein